MTKILYSKCIEIITQKNLITYSIILLILLAIIIVIMFFIKKSNKNNNERKFLLLYIIECILEVLFIFFMLLTTNAYLLIIIFTIYFGFIMIEKYLILNLTFKKCNFKDNEIKEKLKAKDYLLILISPDYLFTKIMKMDLKIYYENKSKKEDRANYIERCNHLNVIISFVFAIILSLAFIHNNEPLKMFFSSLIIYRIISRCVEIIISFVKDVTSKDIKQSNLKSKNRIVLAFYSIFEVCTFAFCTLLMSAKYNFEFIEALFESIGVIINVASSKNLISNVLIIIESMTCTSLIGIVITTYISSTDTSIDLGNKVTPYLRVYKKTGILNVPMNDLNNENYELIVEEKDFLNHRIELIDINGSFINLNSFTKEYLQLIDSNKYRFTKNGRFSLELNKNDKVLTIYLDDDK